MTMTVGDLRRALEGVPDETPVLIGDDFLDEPWDRLCWAGIDVTRRRQRIGLDVRPAGVRVLRLGEAPSTGCSSTHSS